MNFPIEFDPFRVERSPVRFKLINFPPPSFFGRSACAHWIYEFFFFRRICGPSIDQCHCLITTKNRRMSIDVNFCCYELFFFVRASDASAECGSDRRVSRVPGWYSAKFPNVLLIDELKTKQRNCWQTKLRMDFLFKRCYGLSIDQCHCLWSQQRLYFSDDHLICTCLHG